jgi:GTP-binding protein
VAHLTDLRTVVIADIPGLIRGAHEGAGLGARFLQHLRRTRMLLHLVDAADLPERDPLTDYLAIRAELTAYGAGLEKRSEIVLISRGDLLQEQERLGDLERHLAAGGRPAPLQISAVTGAGLDDLRRRLLRELEHVPALPDEAEPREGEVRLLLKEKRR